MELRALIRLASEIIAYYWPMRTFVHHNPLQGLEDLPFEEAVGRARQLLGGKGYLSNEIYRGYFRSGRIVPRHLDLALQPRAQDKRVDLAAREVSQSDVLRAHLLHDLSSPTLDTLDAQLKRHPDAQAIARLAAYLSAALQPPASLDEAKRQDPGRWETLTSWCDRTLGTQIAEQINREMVKW